MVDTYNSFAHRISAGAMDRTGLVVSSWPPSTVLFKCSTLSEQLIARVSTVSVRVGIGMVLLQEQN